MNLKDLGPQLTVEDFNETVLTSEDVENTTAVFLEFEELSALADKTEIAIANLERGITFEDSEATTAYIALIAEDLGYTAEEASDGESFLKTVKGTFKLLTSKLAAMLSKLEVGFKNIATAYNVRAFSKYAKQLDGASFDGVEFSDKAVKTIESAFPLHDLKNVTELGKVIKATSFETTKELMELVDGVIESAINTDMDAKIKPIKSNQAAVKAFESHLENDDKVVAIINQLTDKPSAIILGEAGLRVVKLGISIAADSKFQASVSDTVSVFKELVDAKMDVKSEFKELKTSYSAQLKKIADSEAPKSVKTMLNTLARQVFTNKAAELRAGVAVVAGLAKVLLTVEKTGEAAAEVKGFASTLASIVGVIGARVIKGVNKIVRFFSYISLFGAVVGVAIAGPSVLMTFAAIKGLAIAIGSIHITKLIDTAVDNIRENGED